MKVKFLAGAIVLAVILAAMPNVTAGTITISDVTYTPTPAKANETLHLKAKVNATAGVDKVIVYICYERPTYTCSAPNAMDDANKDGIYEAALFNITIQNYNIYHINISVKDKDAVDKLYVIPPFQVTPGTGKPSDYTTQKDCTNAKFFWWDDECHAEAKTPADFKDKATCESAGHFWWDTKCNADKGTPEKYTEKANCTAVGYYWYSNKCNADKQATKKPFLPGFEGILVFAALGCAGLVALGSRRKKN
jgi:hypothetical protein